MKKRILWQIYSTFFICPLWIIFQDNLKIGRKHNLYMVRQDNVITVCIPSIIIFYFHNFCTHRPIYVDSQKWACIIGYITHNMINEEKSWMYIVKLVLLKVLLLTKHIKTTGIKSLLYVISIVTNTKNNAIDIEQQLRTYSIFLSKQALYLVIP